MLYRKRVTVAVTFVFMVLMMCVSAAFGQTVVTDSQITDQMITNECNGETVLLNGTLHQEMSFTTNPNGNTHSSFNATIHETGYGQTTGVYYVANENVHNETNTKGVAQEQSFGTKIRLISQGPETPNMVDRATLHVVIDKNNVVRVEISKHQIQCK